jgi:hypothetical protein
LKKYSEEELDKLSPEEFEAYMKEKYGNNRFGDIDDLDYMTFDEDEEQEEQTGE